MSSAERIQHEEIVVYMDVYLQSNLGAGYTRTGLFDEKVSLLRRGRVLVALGSDTIHSGKVYLYLGPQFVLSLTGGVSLTLVSSAEVSNAMISLAPFPSPRGNCTHGNTYQI